MPVDVGERLGHTPGHDHGAREADDVQEVGQDQRPRPPLADHAGGGGTDPEPAGHRDRGHARAGQAPSPYGGLDQPRAADAEDRARDRTLREPREVEQRLAVLGDDEEEGRQSGAERCGEHHASTAPPVRGLPRERQRQHQAQRIDAEDRRQRLVRHRQLVAVDQQQRGGHVGPGGRREEKQTQAVVRRHRHLAHTATARGGVTGRDQSMTASSSTSTSHRSSRSAATTTIVEAGRIAPNTSP